ncbi:hypothetical protein [Nocardiopsis kunsanensis]|uniref:Uncharacterized protein n=1 Tax=Nocardiopsis kunsanensis TaxID=141693 RepID=A0A919CIE2_9ACTN|nr:hypothetical protein [Nocardiopsis kunsanensis]GHD27731.1 hypothetical protein GCM10007147_27040 [Nocardiopsis kunsanensis]
MVERPAGDRGDGDSTEVSRADHPDGTVGREAGRAVKAPEQRKGTGAGGAVAQGSGPARRPVRRKPARKDRPDPDPSGPARPWEGDPWRIAPQGMDPKGLKERWTGTQGGFVDDPARAVREADALAAEVADAVVAGIEARRAQLRAVWDGEGARTDTESLRLVLREYRSYVERLAGD